MSCEEFTNPEKQKCMGEDKAENKTFTARKWETFRVFRNTTVTGILFRY